MLSEVDRLYIETVKISDVPWDRLMTSHGTAKKFPQLFDEIMSSDLNRINNAITTMYEEINYKDTIYQAAPFAMIFLVKICKDILATKERDEITNNLLLRLLKVFIFIEESCQFYLKVYGKEYDELTDHLNKFQDMLEEEYLLPENYVLEEPNELPEECDSYIYYTHGLLLYILSSV